MRSLLHHGRGYIALPQHSTAQPSTYLQAFASNRNGNKKRRKRQEELLCDGKQIPINLCGCDSNPVCQTQWAKWKQREKTHARARAPARPLFARSRKTNRNDGETNIFTQTQVLPFMFAVRGAFICNRCSSTWKFYFLIISLFRFWEISADRFRSPESILIKR